MYYNNNIVWKRIVKDSFLYRATTPPQTIITIEMKLVNIFPTSDIIGPTSSSEWHYTLTRPV